jgi:hypothetical protein
MYVHFNIILYTFMYPKSSLPFRFPKYDVVRISRRFMYAISLVFIFLNLITLQIFNKNYMKFLNMQ